VHHPSRTPILYILLTAYRNSIAKFEHYKKGCVIVTVIKNNPLNMAQSTTGDFIKPPGTESILKFGKVNLVITAKKLANAIKTIQKLVGNLLV
jgi:hypothetical protein